MTIMTNIAGEVNKFLDKSPCVRRNMDIKLINISALARRIIKEKKLDITTMDAIISAIRRYKLDSHTPIFDTAYETIGKTPSISTKSKLVCISLIDETEFQNLLAKLFSIIKYNHRDVLRIIPSDKYIEIIVEAKNLDRIKTFFPRKKINKINRNLAEIKMDTHPTAQNTPGVIALIGNELAINSINIVEIIGSGTEILLYVEEKDLVKAHDVIHNLCID